MDEVDGSGPSGQDGSSISSNAPTSSTFRFKAMQTFERHLTLGGAVAVVIGEVIAVGVFLAPAGMIQMLGSPLTVIGAWLAMGLMALSGALTYAALAVRNPRVGGPYVYLREAFGPDLAFLYGWMSLLVMDPGVTAALALGLAEYCGYAVTMSPGQARAVAIGTVLLLSAANIFGARMGAAGVKALACVKVLLLLLIIGWSFASGAGNWSNFVANGGGKGEANLVLSLGGAFVLAFFAYGGWWDLSKLAGEVARPSRTIPQALVLGIGAVTLLYVLLTAAFVYIVPPGEGGQGAAFGAEVGRRILGLSGARVIAGIVVVSILGSMAAVIMSAPRVYYAMGRDGLFLPAIGRLSRWGTPVVAILIQAGMASLMVAWSSFVQLIGYFVFVAVIFIGLGAASIFVPDRSGSGDPASRPWGYPVPPLFFLACVAALLILLLLNDPTRALIGLGVVVLGWPVYRLTARPKHVAAKDRARPIVSEQES